MEITSRIPDRVRFSLASRCKFIFQQPQSIQKKLIPCIKYCMASPGKTIIAEGCRGEHMFVVYSGVCYAFKDASSTKEVLGRSRSDPSTAIEAVGGSFAPLGGGVRSMSQDCSTSMHQIETITNGECFGDTAILNRDCRYSTTVVAAVNVELLVLDLGSIRQVFGAIDTTRLPWLSEKYRPSLKRLPRERTEEDVAKLTDLICEVRFFDQCNQDAKKQLAQKVLYEGYPESEVIMEQGGVGTSFFVLLSGECDVRIRAQHDSIEDHKEHDEEREAASQENRRQDDQTQETEGNSDLAPQQPPRNIARRRGIMAPAHSLDALQMPLVDENEANIPEDMATPQDGDPVEPDIAPQVVALRQIHMDLMKEGAGAKESPKAKQLLTHASNALLDTEDYSNLIWGDDIEEVDSIRQRLEHKYGSVVQEMQSGATFGEVALLTKGSVRLASVVSKTPVDLMIIEKRDYDSILKALQQREIEELVDWLKGIPLLRMINSVNLMRLYYCLKTMNFQRNEVLATEGSTSKGLYLIASGECRLSVRSAPRGNSRDSPRESFPKTCLREIAILGPAQFFGEESFFVKRDHLGKVSDGVDRWITVQEYKRQLGFGKRKDRPVKIPTTTHQYTVVASTSMTVLFLSQQHAPARLGRVVLEQLKAELNVKEEFRAQRIGQIEVATAARVSEPLMNQRARPNFSLWELDNEIRSQQNQHQIVATAEEDMAAIRIEAMGDIWPAKHQPQDPLTPEYFDGSSALPKQHLDFEDQNIALEKLDVDPHVRRQQPSSPCVRFPAEMIAHSCRSPSPNFWKDLLRPVKLLTHMFPPGIPSKVDVKLPIFHNPSPEPPRSVLRKGWREIKNRKELASERLLVFSGDIEREIRHLSDSECRCLLEETLYRSRLDEEFSRAISALNSPATDALQVSDVENDVSWMASSTPLPTIPEDGHLGEAAVVMEEMTSLEVKPLAILNDDGGNDRMSSGGECEKTIVPHNRTPARCSSGIKASQGGVRPTTRPPARNGHRAKGMKLEGNSRIGVGGRNLTLQSPKAGRLRATHTSVPGRVTESRSLGI